MHHIGPISKKIIKEEQAEIIRAEYQHGLKIILRDVKETYTVANIAKMTNIPKPYVRNYLRGNQSVKYVGAARLVKMKRRIIEMGLNYCSIERICQRHNLSRYIVKSILREVAMQ